MIVLNILDILYGDLSITVFTSVTFPFRSASLSNNLMLLC